MRRVFIPLLLASLAVPAHGEEAAAPVLPGPQLERSYIYPFGGVAGNDGELWFESSIAPPFPLFEVSDVALVVTPKIIMRMLRSSSAPIANPSYMPRLTLYRFGRRTETELDYWTFRASHHSNGQSGRLFTPEGSLNKLTGNFATNYLELGRHRVRRGAGQWPPELSVSLEWHPALFMHRSLEGRYAPGLLRVGLATHMSRTWSWHHAAEVRIGDGGSYLQPGWKRLGCESELLIDLPWWRQLALSVNARVGQDYYNVQFPRYLSTLRIGLATNPGPLAR